MHTPHVAVVVAHPDDETLWAGGLILSHPEWSLFIVSLCRGEDEDRAPKFQKAMACLNAKGSMGNLDDGPDQHPLPGSQVKDAIRCLLPPEEFDILLTHGPLGEYSWHRRHGETCQAVQDLWRSGQLRAKSLWQFAYEDGEGAYAPRAQKNTSFQLPLPEALWLQKYKIITEIYGFKASSWEAHAVARTEAFNCFTEGESYPFRGGASGRAAWCQNHQ